MTHSYIQLAGISITVLRKKIKKLYLRVYPPEGNVVISVPNKLSTNLVQSFLQEKLEWIEQQKTRINKHADIKTPLLLEAGETHFFLGKPYTLEIKLSSKKRYVSLQEDKLILYLSSKDDFASKKALLVNWYKTEMQLILPNLLEKWQTIIGVSIKDFRIKYMKSRWGSCAPTSQRINLNVTLMQKPLPCLEMVIVHELIHLIEPGHNKRFYQLMDTYMPNWRDLDLQLKKIDSLQLLKLCQ